MMTRFEEDDHSVETQIAIAKSLIDLMGGKDHSLIRVHHKGEEWQVAVGRLEPDQANNVPVHPNK